MRFFAAWRSGSDTLGAYKSASSSVERSPRINSRTRCAGLSVGSYGVAVGMSSGSSAREPMIVAKIASILSSFMIVL